MTIIGDIVNSGWGYINLTMDAGSYFEDATSINHDFNPGARTLSLALRSPIKENGSLLTVQP